MIQKRMLVVAALLIPVVFVLAAGEAPQRDFKDQKAYRVVRTVDGDTVVVNIDGKETKVRLIGVDTPETVDPRKPVEHYGKQASQFTRNLLKGESVYLEYDQTKTDKYGRTLAYLYRAPDGLFVNLEIVRQGYGHAYTKYPFKYMKLFEKWGKDARENGRGLWAAHPTDNKVTEKTDATGTVYITDTGKKYHRGTCRFLQSSKSPLSLKDAKKRGYAPCRVCRPLN